MDMDQPVLSTHQPLNSLNSNTMPPQRTKRRRLSRSSTSSSTLSIIDTHLDNLRKQLATLERQFSNPTLMDPVHLKSLLDNYRHHELQLKARYKIEEERMNRRYEAETRAARAQFTTKKSELKEILLDRLRRKRKLLVEEMRSGIDIHSRSFEADPLFTAMQAPHPLQAKAYNFRQRPDMGQQTSTSTASYNYSNDEEFSNLLTMNSIGSNGILLPMPPSSARKRLVGAFSIFQLPKWTVREEECEEDLRSIMNHRK